MNITGASNVVFLLLLLLL